MTNVKNNKGELVMTNMKNNNNKGELIMTINNTKHQALSFLAISMGNAIKYGGTMDDFRFLEEMGVSAKQVDMENKISVLEDVIFEAKRGLRKVQKDAEFQKRNMGSIYGETQMEYQKLFSKILFLENSLKELVEELDSLYNNTEVNHLLDDGNSVTRIETWGSKTLEFLKLYVDTLSTSELIVAHEACADAMKEKEMNWLEWVDSSIAILYRICKRTVPSKGCTVRANNKHNWRDAKVVEEHKEWKDELDRMIALKAQHVRNKAEMLWSNLSNGLIREEDKCPTIEDAADTSYVSPEVLIDITRRLERNYPGMTIEQAILFIDSCKE